MCMEKKRKRERDGGKGNERGRTDQEGKSQGGEERRKERENVQRDGRMESSEGPCQTCLK